MTISNKILDERLSGVDRPEDLLGDTGLMKDLKVRLMERMLGVDLSRFSAALIAHYAAFASKAKGLCRPKLSVFGERCRSRLCS